MLKRIRVTKEVGRACPGWVHVHRHEPLVDVLSRKSLGIEHGQRRFPGTGHAAENERRALLRCQVEGEQVNPLENESAFLDVLHKTLEKQFLLNMSPVGLDIRQTRKVQKRSRRADWRRRMLSFALLTRSAQSQPLKQRLQCQKIVEDTRTIG